MIARRKRLLGPAYRLFYENPVHVVRGEGVWLYDPDGRAYLDVYNNVASVGHCHPHVVAALSRQAAMLNTHTRYLHESVLAYAERLLGLFPAGTRAGDVHLHGQRGQRARLAGRESVHRRHRRHRHANSPITATRAPSPKCRRRLAPEWCWATRLHRAGARRVSRRKRGCRRRFRRCGRERCRCDAGARHKPAALLVDTIFSSDGVFADPAGFLEAVGVMRTAGGMFIADEVQPGFGRTGEADVGFPAPRRRARHRHARQADGQRSSGCRRWWREPEILAAVRRSASDTSTPSAETRFRPRSAWPSST